MVLSSLRAVPGFPARAIRTLNHLCLLLITSGNPRVFPANYRIVRAGIPRYRDRPAPRGAMLAIFMPVGLRSVFSNEVGKGEDEQRRDHPPQSDFDPGVDQQHPAKGILGNGIPYAPQSEVDDREEDIE